MDRYRNIRNIFPAILLAANLGAAEAPPHPGEPADHHTLNPAGAGTPARIYAREHPEGPPRAAPVYTTVTSLDHWVISLPKAHPGGADAELTLAVRDGAVLSGYALAPAADNLFHYVSPLRLSLKDGKLTGSVRIRFLSPSQLNGGTYLDFGQERVFLLSAAADGTTISGEATALGADGKKKTAISGTVFKGGRPAKPEDALAADAAWPGHRGPLASGAAKDYGHTLVGDMAKARPVWKSDVELPDGRAYASSGGNVSPAQRDSLGVDWLRVSGAKYRSRHRTTTGLCVIRPSQ